MSIILTAIFSFREHDALITEKLKYFYVLLIFLSLEGEGEILNIFDKE